MKIFELFDKTVPWKKISNRQIDKEGTITYGFTIDDDKFFVLFKPWAKPKDTWHVSFYKHDGNTDDYMDADFGITGEGNAYLVFATVMDIIKSFTAEMKPNEIYFTADEGSRTKLYDKMISKLRMPGYTNTKLDSDFVSGSYVLSKDKT